MIGDSHFDIVTFMSRPEVFIIESLTFEDEEEHHSEGQIISESFDSAVKTANIIT